MVLYAHRRDDTEDEAKLLPKFIRNQHALVAADADKRIDLVLHSESLKLRESPRTQICDMACFVKERRSLLEINLKSSCRQKHLNLDVAINESSLRNIQ
ncbi:hypothetical protein D6D13_02272 [Aureobasidium pullulans]|uniref:Uncharacterized protein n=1 Tax=Aureobasidium pullulans TaxID=5580 RepID=A0A4S9D7K3_AURPU|nr:hypothetical protein D6D13_02272 [Aureobasidium pullulans]